MTKKDTQKADIKNRIRRLRWWEEARFGMFIHWGVYSVLGRHEWAMNRERIPVEEYEKLADTWKPKERPAPQWARLAKQAGMKYMVMTTKHHEGFCLWDTKQTDYNALNYGPKRDLVREYVDACREYGLKVGLYYSLMDWHHPDGARCAKDEKARRRFVDFTRGCVRELCSNYGKIDILWYDCPKSLKSAKLWESSKLNAMVRKLQPDIIINDRSLLDEDFSTPEGHVTPAEEGRAWESCLTLNDSWGWQSRPPEDWKSVRQVLEALRIATAGDGNLLLNIGPKPDGSVPAEACERLVLVGKWLAKYGEAVYGKVDRVVDRTEWMNTGFWTSKGKTAYYWCFHWPGRELAIGGLHTKVKKASFLHNGKSIKFEQIKDRLILRDLPRSNPDKIAGVCVIKLECNSKLRHVLGSGCVLF